MKEITYTMPNTYKKFEVETLNKKAKVIINFTFMDEDYSIGDLLDIVKTKNSDTEIVIDGKNCICGVNSVFFRNRFEIVGEENELVGISEHLNNNKKVNTVLRKYLIREIMRLHGTYYIEQAEKLVDKFVGKLNMTNETIMRKGTTSCANEILESLSFEKKNIRKEFGIEEQM